MTPYFAAAIQSAFTGLVTFTAAALFAHGITADVTSVTAITVALTYAATLLIAALRDRLIRSIPEATLMNSNVPEPATVLADNPWADPDLVENARDFINEEESRESIRAFWRRSGSGKASFRDAHAPIINFVQKG